jgi:uncharacterized repeat protein (TIGR01451 family)
MMKRWLVVMVALVGPPVFAGTIVIRKATFPSGGSGFTYNETITTGSFNLSDGQTQTFSSVAAGTYIVTETPAAGFTLADLSCDDVDSTVDLATATATVNLGAAETVTCTFRNLETAPTDQIFVFHLSGDQEVPSVPTSQRGGCMGRLDAGSSELAIVCTHEVAGPTAMHIHDGAPGVNGPILFDFGNPATPVVAAWSGMTPADVAKLLAGNLYVNIHTSAYPNGFIRGQILPRTVDTVSFPMNGSGVVPPSGSASTGNCTADLDANATALSITCTHNVASPTAAHVHDAPAGTIGPVVFTFPSAASPMAGNMPTTPRFVADYEAGFLSVDVHAGGPPVIAGQPDGVGADVSITKSGPPAATAGTNVSYTVTASNTGPQDAASVTITDTLPAGTTFVSATQNSGPSLTCTTPAPDSVVCSGGPLGVGATASITIVVATSPSATLPITNNASIAASPADPDLSDNSASATTNLMAPTDLTIAKTAGAGPVVAGGPAQFTITVANAGTATALAATVTDALPAGMSLVSTTPSQGTCSGTTTIVCTLGSINVAASATIALNVTLPATAGPVTNVATVTSSNDGNPANDTASVTITTTPPPADLTIAKTAGAGPFVTGGAAQYTITITNIGANPALAPTVTDVLPPGMTLVTATPSQGSCTGTTTVVCTLGTINASASATITLNVTLPATAGPVANTVTVSSSNDTNPANDSSAAPITVGAAGQIPALSPMALALLAMTLAAAGWMRR